MIEKEHGAYEVKSEKGKSLGKFIYKKIGDKYKVMNSSGHIYETVSSLSRAKNMAKYHAHKQLATVEYFKNRNNEAYMNKLNSLKAEYFVDKDSEETAYVAESNTKISSTLAAYGILGNCWMFPERENIKLSFKNLVRSNSDLNVFIQNVLTGDKFAINEFQYDEILIGCM